MLSFLSSSSPAGLKLDLDVAGWLMVDCKVAIRACPSGQAIRA